MEDKPDRREEIDRNIFENGVSAVYDERLRVRIAEVLDRLPEEDLDLLLYERVIRVVQPVVNTVIELGEMDLSMRDESGRITLMAFETGLCDRPEAEVAYFIAHEFAHVFLGHATNREGMDRKCEIEADEQVIRWGFEEELLKSSFNYKYGKDG